MTGRSDDVVDRLNAMRAREETTKCCNYFRSDAAGDGPDESCRGAMATWLGQVQKKLNMSPESVWISMSYFDRYLSSGRGRSNEALRSKREFQLAAITVFYIAVKIHEPVEMGLDMMAQICRGAYAASDIAAMERDILSALDWRVSCHTPMVFARHLLELLSEEMPSYVADELLEDCQKTIDCTISDIYFSSFAPSVLGASCLAASLSNSDILSPWEKQACWSRLSELPEFDPFSAEVAALRQCLRSFALPQEPVLVQKLSRISQSDVAAPSSPVCVTRAVRRA